MKCINVVLADDHVMMREGLRSLLETQPDIKVVGQASNGREAVQLICEHRPDVAILDITMPELNGIEATRQALAEVPELKVLALSMHADPNAVHQMLRAGAHGYVLKECAFSDLIVAVHAVLTDQSFFSPQIANIVLQGYLNPPAQQKFSAFKVLTGREREVLQLVAEGHSTKGIADKLYVSIKTVEKHRQQLMKKLGLYGVADLTRCAIREGMIPLGSFN